MADERYKLAKKRVKKIKEFYEHAFAYVVVNGVLLVVNLMISPTPFWAGLVALFWGIGLAFHAWDVYGLDEDWEERKIAEMLGETPRKRKNSNEEFFDLTD